MSHPMSEPAPRISDLIEEHAMTLRDGAMVCRAGDWPPNSDAMPETEDTFSQERIEYAVERVMGHREHLVEVVDAAQAATWNHGYGAGQAFGWEYAQDTYDGPSEDPTPNPYESLDATGADPTLVAAAQDATQGSD